MAHVFDPISIGSLTLKNRIMMAPMENGMAKAGGEISDRIINFFAERARNDAAIIMTGSVTVDPEGAGLPAQISIYDDRFLHGLKRLCAAVHAEGAKIGAQIYHAGRQATEAITGLTPVAASAIPCAILGNHPRMLAKEELPVYVRKFEDAALRAVEAGFDLIEVHFAHGYLLAGFLSPHSNHRDDEYGGSLKNRCRFPFEVLTAMMRAVDGRIPVTIRISVSEFLDDGLQFEDVKQICLKAQEAGVKAVSITAGCYDSVHTSIQPMYVPQGFLVPYAEELKKILSIPVIVAARLNDGKLIEDIVENKKADMVAIGRGFFADSEIVRKLKAGDYEGIRYCVACNQGCCDNIFVGNAATCMLNARASFEAERQVGKSSSPKTVCIIGAGPAGMEAARVASERGHRVVLFEQNEKLGSKIELVAAPPEKDTFLLFRDYLCTQMARLGVTIVHEKVTSADMLAKYSPDVVILATGARQTIPPILGKDSGSVVLAESILSGEALPGRKAVVIGGGLVGVETAHFMAAKGVKVTILEMMGGIAKESGATYAGHIQDVITKFGIDVHTSVKVEEISDSEVRYSGGAAEADTVVIAAGYKPCTELLDSLKAAFGEVHVVGDASKPRNILTAVHEAFLSASAI